MPQLTISLLPVVFGLLVLVAVFKSLKMIGPTDIGLVTKRFGKKSDGSNVIARNGEAGFQSDLLMPGLRFKLWPIYTVRKYPWVQVPAGEIGVVIAQVGKPLPTGAKSAEYDQAFGDFQDLDAFLDGEGQRGVQRPVLPPGSLVPIHPVAFMVITRERVYGEPVSSDLPVVERSGDLSVGSFGLNQAQLNVVNITPERGLDDVIGIVTVLEGQPLDKGDIASRLDGYKDIETMEADNKSDGEIISALLGTKNDQHNNYQDFQKFLDQGGRIGLQHDPLLYGAYLLNPFLVNVELVPMTVVEQGEVAVIKSYVGLPSEDTSGDEFKFGTIVKPGHQGVWTEVLRTGKYPINPRCYSALIVPTSILTLNWAEATSEAHDLDRSLSQIDAKSREGFVFRIDLQVQIHVPDTQAARVISAVGTMENLINEVLQSAVGNYFRNTLQQLEAIKFIETRDEVQTKAEEHIKKYLVDYDVEVRGVYIQDVVLPEELVQVLTTREIANQSKLTFEQEKQAQDARISLENAKGTADQQADLAASKVSIEVAKNGAEAKTAVATGEAAYTTQTGDAEAHVIKAKGEAEGSAAEALGVGRAKGYEAQSKAVGQDATAMVAVFGEISDGNVKIVPDVLVSDGGTGDGLMATLTKFVSNQNGSTELPTSKDKPSTEDKGDKPEAPVEEPVATSEPEVQPESEEKEEVSAEVKGDKPEAPVEEPPPAGSRRTSHT